MTSTNYSCTNKSPPFCNSPVPATVNKVKSDNIEVEFRRPVCLFDKGSVALSRRIAERWRLIGAGIIG